MTAVEFYHEEMLEMERKWQMGNLNFGQWKEMADEALRKAKEMEKERMLEFGTKVAMKAHTGKSGWSIIEVYNENK
jgi:hypothetical protein